MISILSKFKRATTINGSPFRESRNIWSRRKAIIQLPVPRYKPPASCGEGEHLKKRTERGYMTGSGINTSQPKCDGLAPAFMGFLAFPISGGKGAYAQNFTSVHGFGNEKRSKSDGIGTDHDIAGAELPDRPTARRAYNVIDLARRLTYARERQE